MDAPVLSGGVIVLVAAVLWMLYLLPSVRGRHQYNSAERNAVRLNQALRVLAETSETPREVHLELSARTANAQQKLAKQVQSQREAAELVALKAELAAARADPRLRQARARRNVRLVATVTLLVGLAAVGLGAWHIALGGGYAYAVLGAALSFGAGMALQRMSSVARRAARVAARATASSVLPRQNVPLHDQGPATWTPRTLPRPLTARSGSLAQAAQAGIDEHEAIRQGERVSELRERAERMTERPVALPQRAASEPEFAKMGYVDDAEIEAHVRQLFAHRASA